MRRHEDATTRRLGGIGAVVLGLIAIMTPAEAQEAGSAAADPVAARSKGSPSAPVTVYEMSDFQCPFCRKHATETFPALEAEYVRTGRVRWVFVNFPLTSIHPNAAPAAELALCAARAGSFWPVHDLLFLHQATWAKVENPAPFFLSLADSAGVPRSAIAGCLERGEARDEIDSDLQGALRTGARSTPSFYIEGGLLSGAHPPEVFRGILDSILAVREKK
jgi:protein-disulfide isomerase